MRFKNEPCTSAETTEEIAEAVDDGPTLPPPNHNNDMNPLKQEIAEAEHRPPLPPPKNTLQPNEPQLRGGSKSTDDPSSALSSKVASKVEVNPKVTAESKGGRPTINFVWISPGDPENMRLKPSDRFNMFSWRALGFHVKIFTHRRDYEQDLSSNVHSLLTLGFGSESLEGIEVIELRQFLETSSPTVDAANNMRRVLLAWFEANDEMEPTPWLKNGVWKDITFNAVDLTKSYLAAVLPGLTMDSKVGPSEHFVTYASNGVFNKYFVSFTRGGNTFGRP